MAFIELPHTAGCMVCGQQNIHGLHLSLQVDPDTSVVKTEWTPEPHTIGFSDIVHGGVIAMVLDEAMVWAATWAGKRFCLCGELTTRFRHSLHVGRPCVIEAKVDFRNPRLVQTSATVRQDDGTLLATASGKYTPVTIEQNLEMIATFIDDPTTAEAANILRQTQRA